MMATSKDPLTYDKIRAARQQREEQLLADTRIDSQIQNHYAAKFKERFPANIEHCLRMAQEQLQTGLKTRTLKPEDIANLSQSVLNLYHVYVSESQEFK